MLWPRGAKASFSAFGEDLIVRSWLEAASVPHSEIRYLDIGASHPTILSNTFELYRIGGRGVVVEPNRHEGDLISRKRPRDTLIRAGVAFDDRRRAMLFQFAHSVYNTFDPEVAAKTPDLRTKVEVELIPANEIIQKHFSGQTCHFLSIDAEGLDDRILQTIDFENFSPWLICVESPPERSMAARALLERGYVVMCLTPHNTILAKADLRGKAF